MTAGKTYKYHIGAVAVLANPPGALIYRLICIFAFFLIGWGLIMDGGSILLWFFLIALLAVAWKVFACTLLPIRLRGAEAELCITDSIIGLEVGKSYFYIPREGAVVRPGLFSTNIIKGSSGGLLLINSKAVPLATIEDAICNRA